MNRIAALIEKGLPAIGAAALCIAGLAPVTLPAAALAETPSSAESGGGLAQAVTALRGISTLRAQFSQIDANGQRASGVLTLKRGGRIRFQYAPGYPMLIIGDGHALMVIDTELRQMQRWPIGNSPLGALLDPARDVTRYGALLAGSDPALTAIAVRDRAHPEYGTMTLIFTRRAGAPGGLELAAWTTVDAQNRRTVVRLSGHQYGVAADDSLFTYLDPHAGPHH